MAAQPLNTTISVYLAVRSYRQDYRHESVAAIIKRLRPLVMSIPGQEILVGVLFRDTTVSDFSSYMGQASPKATRGFPIVIGALPVVGFDTAQANVPDVDFAFQIGADKFLRETAAGLANDSYASYQSLSAFTEGTQTSIVGQSIGTNIG